jgi:predicted nuclease of predicted toxin-antitoxin system
LAVWLRDQGHDALHAADIGLARASDAEIIMRAKSESWTIVTADLDYPRLLALAQTDDPSLILFRGGNWRDDEIVTRMANLLCSLSESDLAQSMIVVERDRVRRRRLPIGGA